MGTQVTLTIPDELYRRAQRLAEARQRDVADVLAEAIILTNEPHQVDLAPDEDIDRERAAYVAMHSMLWEKYRGQYVAIYHGEMIDHDTEFAALYSRVHKQYPDQFVLIRQVEVEPERVYYFRSPRFTEE